MNLSDREQRLIRELSVRYQSTDTPLAQYYAIADVHREANETEHDIHNLLHKLVRLHLLDWHTNQSVEILPALIAVCGQLENRPPRNHFNELVQWWFATKWRAIVTVITIVLPLVVQWLEMIQKVLSWILPS